MKKVSRAAFLIGVILPLIAHADIVAPPPPLDATAPTIVAPADQSFGASIFPVTPSLSPATAVDDVDPAPAITYAPHTFTLGTTTVIWTATDTSGNSTTTTSEVGIYDTTPAPVSITLRVETATGTLMNATLTVTACAASAASTERTVTGRCALEQSGLAADVSDTGWINALGGVANDFAGNHYWGWWHDRVYGDTGIHEHLLSPGEHLLVAINHDPLKLGPIALTVGSSTVITAYQFGFDASWSPAWTFATSSTIVVNGARLTADATGSVSFTPTSTDPVAIYAEQDGYTPTDIASVTPGAAPSQTFSGGTDPYATAHAPVFDTEKALAFLVSRQSADGSFGSPLLTDWAALALSNHPGSARDLVRSYLLVHHPPFSAVTDYERHAMALESLGVNPYDGAGIDVIAPIIAAFDGMQVGDQSLATDDIFALFPLLHAGYTQRDAIIQKIAAFIISRQKPDGSWEGGPDVTAAAVQALGPLYTVPGYGAALGKASGYLAAAQQSDGSWGTIDATSWVQIMSTSIAEGDPAHAPVFKSASGKTAADALAAAQQSDGGVASTGDRTWSTAYAVVAASGKSWISLLQNFSKPAPSSTLSGGTDPYAAGTTVSVATTTSVTATSTPPAATSTPSPATSTEAIATTTRTVATSSPATTTPFRAPLLKKKPITPHRSPIIASTTPPSSPQVAAAADARSSLWGRFAVWLRSIFKR